MDVTEINKVVANQPDATEFFADLVSASNVKIQCETSVTKVTLPTFCDWLLRVDSDVNRIDVAKQVAYALQVDARNAVLELLSSVQYMQ